MISTLFSAFPPVHFVSLHPFRPHVRLIWHILFLSAREVLKFLCLPRLVCNARASTASRRTTHAKTAAFGLQCTRIDRIQTHHARQDSSVWSLDSMWAADLLLYTDAPHEK